MTNNTSIEEQKTREQNKILIEEYPFLQTPGGGYDCTWLDCLPEGWRSRFGEKLCKELKQALINMDALEDYKIYDVKEKFGGLRWYDNAAINSEAYKVIEKYEKISYSICFSCGARATKGSIGYILYFCDDCARKYRGMLLGEKFVELNPLDEETQQRVDELFN